MLKFAKPDIRQQILVDSGFRCHLTDFSRATAAAPSPFVVRLRKYLRTRRVTSITQVGTDRILEFQFSDGQYRLFLEFYAGGNVVLTDKELTIISLLRIVPQGPDQEELRVGLNYSLDDRQNYHGVPALKRQRLVDALQKAVDGGEKDLPVQKKKFRKHQGDTVRKALSVSLSEFPPVLIDHAMRLNNFSSDIRPEHALESDSVLDELMHTLTVAQGITKDITSFQVCKGFIIARALKPTLSEVETGKVTERKLVYEDFHPFRPKQSEEDPEIHILEFEGFNKAVDEFFSSVESQKLESRLNEREENAKMKLYTARKDHDKRLQGLQQAQQLNVRKAEAIEASLQKVQEAIAAINGLIAQGMDWVEIARLIEMEQTKQNVVAEMISLPLKLYENTVTLLLPRAIFDAEGDYEDKETGSDVSVSDEDGPTNSRKSRALDDRLAVDIDLGLSPWSNARQYYDQKKTAAVKEKKTIESSARALKSTERKVNADLKKGLKQEKEVMRPVRKQLWFEKFIYFISSEGYLVLGGRDAQQNEILYKRYLKRGDIYVHADLHGAASIIIKNKAGMMESPVPPSTLSQAGTLAVATSSVWNSKAVMSAWWVRADQVSKTPPTGEYLSTGCFTVNGRKSFLPPAQLLLGFGVMFQISEGSKAKRLTYRFAEDGTSGAEHDLSVAGCGRNTGNENGTNQSAGLTRIFEGTQRASIIGDADTDIDSENDEASQERSEVESEAKISNHSDDGLASHAEGTIRNRNEGMKFAEPEVEVLPDRRLFVRARSNPLLSYAVEVDVSSQESDVGSADEKLNRPEAEVEKSTGNGRDQSPSSQVGPSSESSTGHEVMSVRHLSARERRLLRQTRRLQCNDMDHQAEPTPTLQSNYDERISDPLSSNKRLGPMTKPHKNPQALPARGKHGKRNKMKTKYAGQDDEERLLALQVLGSMAGQQKAADDAEAEATKEVELAAQKERRRKQQILAAEKGKEAEEIRKINMRDGTEPLNDEDMESHCDLDAFVGTVLPDDQILDALVVCGPWDAIGSRCKWRAKLQPGTTKKGKAVREILNAWSMVIKNEDKKRGQSDTAGDQAASAEKKSAWREGELIKAIREQEVIGIVPVGKCRVTVGGGGGDSKNKGGEGASKGKRGGKGSKKQR